MFKKGDWVKFEGAKHGIVFLSLNNRSKEYGALRWKWWNRSMKCWIVGYGTPDQADLLRPWTPPDKILVEILETELEK